MVTRPPRPAPKYSKARLHALIEETIVDAYDEAEQRGSFAVVMEENLAMPFEVEILAAPAIVVGLIANDGGELVAVCRRGNTSVRISLLDLPRPEPTPDVWEWVEAYRVWARGGA